jgi:hypothetical protein
MRVSALGGSRLRRSLGTRVAARSAEEGLAPSSAYVSNPATATAIRP